MKGFFNRLLRIDLTNQSFEYEEIPDEVFKKTLGGKGLGVHYLLNENPVGVDPCGPESRVIIAIGPATGTKLWGQSRFAVFAKSPATGGYGESYCGGSLAPKINACGSDAIILTGKSPELTYLKIEDNRVIFESAEMLGGKNSDESEKYILDHSEDGAGAMVIGPAGESQVRFACIKSDIWRSVGRGGMGAVFGGKNLKGISFFGTQKTEIANPDLFKKVNKLIAKNGKESPGSALYRQLGTPMMVNLLNKNKAFPTEYWKSGLFEEHESINADYMQENCEVKADNCPNCFLRCTKKTRILKGRHKGLFLEGPEYETFYAIGGLNRIDSMEEIAYLNDVCDKIGVDTMSAGNMAAFAIEAFKLGKSDFEIDYNQPDKIVELLALIVKREGIGAVLAKGIKEASHELGLEDIAVHVKGLEPSGYDPRTLKGMALSYATSARGACHLRGTFYKAELAGLIDKDQIEGKAEMHIDFEDRSALFDCMILCRFFRDLIQWDELGMIIEAIMGLKMTKGELQIIANRITQNTRKYNQQEGLDSTTDTLPKRMFNEATKEGESISEADLISMVNDYNQIRESRV
ncbi:MAG: aldehyde ferredoxin oxidoreductase family protein [Deltaproteobacteria bacterium]|jgi:aldehyde:ferredoxin oxidoreductase|nr:aldehyde ferredoxin oxidoreductase family protein [Deltaproteobacteria bacterium]